MPPKDTARTSSLADAAISPEKAKLQEKVNHLKRTASTLSQESSASGTLMVTFLNIQIELAETKSLVHQESIHELQAASKDDMLASEEQEREARQRAHIRKKAKCIGSAAIYKTIRSEMQAAGNQDLAEGISASYKAQIMDLFKVKKGDLNESLNITTKGKAKKQAEWREELISHYACEEPASLAADTTVKPYLWCPVFQNYEYPEARTAAHIMPLSTGSVNASYLLSEDGRSYTRGTELLWAKENGLIMHHILEKHFDSGAFTIVAIPTQPGRPQRFQSILLNTAHEDKYIAAKKDGLKWKDIHRRELVFKNDARPQRRYLHYHYITSIWRMEYYRGMTVDELRARHPPSVDWATSEKYLRGSMLRQLRAMYGGRYLGENPREFEHGTFVGTKNSTMSEVEEVILAVGSIRRMEKPVVEDVEDTKDDDDDGDEDETSEESSNDG